MKLISEKPIALHFVDNSKRDLYWRIQLAGELTKIGVTSVIGKSTKLKQWVSSSRNTVILGRLAKNDGCNGYEDPTLKMFCDCNANVIFFHDEGAFYSRSSYEGSLHRSHMLQCALHEKIKKIIFWGSFQERMARVQCPDAKNKFEVIGAPRFDIYHSPYKDLLNHRSCENIARIDRPYILIATRGSSINPSGINPFALGQRIRELTKYGLNDEQNVERVLFGKWAKQSLDAIMVIKAISRLSFSFPGEVFVIRPHPGENVDFYKNAFRGYDNVKIRSDGDLGCYLRLSKLVIGNDCTSGFEALMAGIPFVNYRASSGMLEDHSVYGLSEIGEIAESEESLTAEVQKCIDTNFESKESIKKSLESQKNNIANIDNPAIPRIVDLMSKEIKKLNIKKSYICIGWPKVNILNNKSSKHSKLEISSSELMSIWGEIKRKRIADEDANIRIGKEYVAIIPRN